MSDLLRLDPMLETPSLNDCRSRISLTRIQFALKRPHAIHFSRKNDIHPFDDTSSLEFFASKNDASLFVTGLDSKKRPNDLIFTRMFGVRLMDQIEVGVEAIRPMSGFEVRHTLS